MKNIFNKTQRAWSFYDWANSVYSLVIGTVLLPIYYETMTKEAGLERMHFMGMDFHNTELYSYVISLSFLIIAILSPYLASLADFSGKKKSFMRVFVTTGSIACVSLFFFDEGTIWLGLTAALLASVGFTGSLVFYNAFLPEVAKPELQDKLSARGFALGYLGSSILLILNLLMIQQPQWFGIEHAGISTRISFLLVGLWWMGFSQYTFKHLPNKERKEGVQPKNMLAHGYQKLGNVWREFQEIPRLKRFLVAFFLCRTGVQTGVFYAVTNSLSAKESARVNNFAHVNYKKGAEAKIGKLLCINGAGIQYRWLLNNLAVSSYEEMNTLASSIPVGSDGVCLIPFGNGAERMLNNKEIGTRIVNLNLNNQ